MNETEAVSGRIGLIEKAKAVAQNAYAPYSKFRVGAAVLTERSVYLGTNVENASYGLTICAEMAALSATVAAGDHAVKAIAIACIDAIEGAPLSERVLCGVCRQWITELAPDALIYIAGVDRVFTISELLPRAFQFEPKAQ
jgi:cytidine deaminase